MTRHHSNFSDVRNYVIVDSMFISHPVHPIHLTRLCLLFCLAAAYDYFFSYQQMSVARLSEGMSGHRQLHVECSSLVSPVIARLRTLRVMKRDWSIYTTHEDEFPGNRLTTKLQQPTENLHTQKQNDFDRKLCNISYNESVEKWCVRKWEIAD